MPKAENVTCDTPKCIEHAKQHGWRIYYNEENSEVYSCEVCGGKRVNGVWEHKCSQCHVDVEPGQLTGLFVPHSCAPCMKTVYKHEHQTGQVCRSCNRPYSACSC